MLFGGGRMPGRSCSLLALMTLLAEAPPALLSTEKPSKECGRRMVENDMATGMRIIGGRSAQAGAWPWQVSIQIYQKGVGYLHLCGGTLINKDYVLSAAHCTLKSLDPGKWRAVFGLHQLYMQTNYTIYRQVEFIWIHDDFNKKTYENDIALFKLKKSIKYNEYVQPICLFNSSRPLTDEIPCYISGWGLKKENGSASYILREAQVKLIPLEICNSLGWYMGSVSKNNICAGSESGHVDSCQGDSGGPLMCYLKNEDKYYLIGITSYGYGCGRPRSPGIYVNLAKYKDWLHSKLNNRTTTLCSHHMLIFFTVLWVASHYSKIISD
ncbi:transmembrane protease serine 12 isoform X1 [Anolis carolinensis]|uniref:transmembrane protease serine 12 isoform X1 n=1 Tax=Anolis carolinensis TaxID=28377 RepID=UPI00020389EF